METAKESLLSFTTRGLRAYGEEVIGNRMIPEFRDGLKPVHRAILWSMVQLGLNPSGGFKKCARSVGHTLGVFHPHGDCLHRDTKVPLLDGTIKTIKELADERAGYKWVLAYDEETKSIVPAKAHSWRVGKRSQREYTIVLSSGEHVKCTGNHPFFVKGKGWRSADSIREGDALIGGTCTFDDTYPVLRTNDGFVKKLHHVVGEAKYGQIPDKFVFHHNDEDTHNNTPRNIKKVSKAKHALIHDNSGSLITGRAVMRSKRYKSAIKTKNSALMKAHNENLWLIKAVKVIRAILAAGDTPTPEAYEAMRSSVYNLTRLSTLEEKGYSFKRLCKEAPDFFLDTSAAIGHTKHLRKNTRVVRKYSGISGKAIFTLSKVFKKLLKHTRLTDVSWDEYLQFARNYAGSNASLVKYTDKRYLKDTYGVKSVEDLAGVIPSYLLNTVELVRVDILKSKEYFYDFTVDKYENMVVLTSDGDRTGNFVIAHNSSIYDALIKIGGVLSESGEWVVRHSNVPLVECYGNIGSALDNPAAFRYTEARLSKFAQAALLDPQYLAVTEFIPNFSEDDKIPLVFPALLPVLLLNGSLSVAFAVAANFPAFKPDGVCAIARLAFERKVTYKDCQKLLHPAFQYGGACVTDANDLKAFYKSGKGTLAYEPAFRADEKNRIVYITSLCPGLTTENALEKLDETLSALETVQKVADISGGKMGAVCIRVTAQRSVKAGEQFQQFFDQVRAACVKRMGYDIGVVSRTPETAKFYRSTIHAVVNDWATWRTELELKMLRHQIGLRKSEEARFRLLRLACVNLKIIMAALAVEDSAQYLVDKLKISLDDANAILDMRVRQLKALETARLDDQIAKTVNAIKSLEKDCKNPVPRIIASIDALAKLV